MPLTNDAICWQHQEAQGVASVNESARAGEKAYHLILLAVCAAVLAASFVLQPNEEGLSLFGYRWPFYCWLHETLGIRCALCGMSRSFCSLAHGDAGASLGFHHLGPFLFALFCLQIPYRVYSLAVRPGTIDRRAVKAHAGLVVLLCAAIACNWLLYLEGLIV